MADQTPLAKSHTVRLSPTNPRVLDLLNHASRTADGDPVQTYGNLLSAATLAARFIGLSGKDIDSHVALLIPQVDRAMKARPDIFGGAANDH